ncbi:MAG: helix-turn-helix domain-containing protein [Rhodospirillales bacterium]|nr:helix-turn-helix domain-containing protein [Rhodospirillales bacterium]MCB9995786.1 helix-turn-helix domain-containing protein [Rhodospirillales bacterium]
MANSDKKGAPNPVDIHVGERLRARRTLEGLSQEKLAESVGITFQQVQKYERGTNRISASRLWQFSKILGVSIAYFFESYRDNKANPALAYGLADNEQESFQTEEDVMDRKETLDLIREYYSIPDPKMRRDLFKMIKTMAASMRSGDE